MSLSIQEKQEIHNLFTQFFQSKDVRIMQEIAQRSVGLVVYTINLYFNRLAICSDRDDYFQEGCLALIKAIHTWDGDKGNFEGYAIATIRGKLMQFSCQLKAGGLKISVSQREKFVSLRKKYLPLKDANLPLWYICEKLGVDRQGLSDLESFLIATSGVHWDDLKNSEKALDCRNQFEEEMFEIFEDKEKENRDRIAEIEKALLELPVSERDRLIFCKYYGLHGYKKRFLREVAQEYGVQSVSQTISYVRIQLGKIQEIRKAKNWLCNCLSKLAACKQKVFSMRYGLDGKTPLGHISIARQLGFKKETSIQYIKEGWKELSLDPLASEMRKILWWKDV